MNSKAASVELHSKASPQPRLITELAKKALDESRHNRVRASKMLRGWLDSDEALKKKFMEPLIDYAIWEQIRMAARRDRRAFFSGPPPREDFEKSQAGLKQISRRNWYDMLLPSGIKLGDAKREDLAEAESFYRLQADSNLARAEWIAAIRGRLRKGQTVRKALNNQQLERIAHKRMEEKIAA